MTAQSGAMESELLRRMSAALLEVHGISAVLYDLTHKLCWFSVK